MAERAIEKLESIESEVEEQASRLKSFTVNHPGIAKVVGVAAITAATFGALTMWKARQESVPTEGSEDVVLFDASSKTA